MAEQLILLDPSGDWSRLDEHTRLVGLRGVAEARRILMEKVQAAEAARRDLEEAGTAAAA